MIATWTGAVSNDWNNDDNWRPAVVPVSRETTAVPANPTSGRQPASLDGETGSFRNDEVITLASSCDQTNFVVIGQVTTSGAGALTRTDGETNRIYSGASGSPLANPEPIKGAGEIFNYAVSPAQIFNPTGAI
jgi:hypothetical protein